LQPVRHGTFCRRSVSTPTFFYAGFAVFGVLLSEIGFHFDGICFSSVLLDGPMGLEIQM
jgi:hypothetical protein